MERKLPPGRVELTVYVPVGLRKQLRVRAAREDSTISALVERCIRRGLQEKPMGVLPLPTEDKS